MKVTIKGKKTTMKLDVGGTLKQKLDFIAALTGVAVELDQPAPPIEEK